MQCLEELLRAGKEEPPSLPKVGLPSALLEDEGRATSP